MSHAVLAFWLSAFAADGASTCYALHHGAVEVLQTQSCGKNAAILAGQATLEGLALRALARHHPKFAAVLTGLDGGVHAGAAVHNMRP